MRQRLARPVAALLVLVLVACSGGDDSDGASSDEASGGDEALVLEAASTRPEYVTGGDVVVTLSGPAVPASADEVVLTLDGESAEVEWTTTDEGLIARVDGLADGDNELVATVGDATATITVTDHPTTGPLFSGPHQPMPVCATELFDLGPPIDDDCTAADTVTTWSYVNDAGERVPLTDPATMPDDVATMADGETPFILREEKGTLNRAVYFITVPDPAPVTDDPAPWDAGAWNGRLVYGFGGGCGVSYSQGSDLLRPQADIDVLSEGYAFATSTLNIFQVTCNPVVSAETTMVVKEHFSERYGLPELTIGTGASGGAIQQYQMIQSYPGLLDASGALLGFPDAISIATDVLDCGLLEHFARDGAGAAWADDERLAVSGHLTAQTCPYWERAFVPNVDPQVGCPLDTSLLYHPDTNPDGLRCTLQDGNVNVLGIDPDTGFARRPWDNVGVQYGLAALNAGDITVDQFLDLNEGVGSYDIDGQWTAERASVSEETMRIAYESGAVNEGGGDLRRIPIVSVNVWTDEQGDIHTRDRVFTVRERLRTADGTNPPNHMIWTRGLPAGATLASALTGAVSLDAEVVSVLDEWATALEAEVPDRGATDDETLVDALEATRPPAAVDNCITPDGERVSSIDLYEEPGPCTDPYPISSTPRRVAGASLRHDILKCALQPVSEATYDVQFTEAQQQRLARIFPDGVCDWSQPGVGQVEMTGTWQRWDGEPT